MPHYAGLDVSNRNTVIHVVDDMGKLVWRGKRASEPEMVAVGLHGDGVAAEQDRRARR